MAKSLQQGIKRGIDFAGAVLLLLATSPLSVAAAIGVLITSDRPVLFRQTRPGLHGEPFTILKFRTMRDALASDGSPLPDEQRITRFGNLLRRTSVDEIPQLWNVLTGELSLVGPRPLLTEYLPLYSPEQARRHEVRPGITGLAQVNGRNGLDWEEKFALDTWYIEHWSLWMDLKIVLKTVCKVVRRDGISRLGDATMPKFTGSTTARRVGF